MRIIPIFLFLAVFSACSPSGEKNDPQPFIRGVYGNPGTLLDAGYSFDSLGMNAVFVRSISLNREFFDLARQQGCRVYVEFPTLNGRNYLQDHPEAWPINEKGEQSPPADWFMGICPTHPGFREYRANQLEEILTGFDVDGIFLDYLHWHAQFETTEPILPETCFCDRCTDLFGKDLGRDIPGETKAEKAGWIMDNEDMQWRDWRNSILNGWVTGMGDIVRELRPQALLGVYYCSWYPADHDSALYRILGIDVPALAGLADVLSPMLFHKMKDRPARWVGEYIQWLDELTGAGEMGTPLVWPIVQAHNNPGVVTPEEFREVMLQGSSPPSSGIMMFSDQSLLQDPAKIEVMKELYFEVLR
jgi:hypothetical protein